MSEGGGEEFVSEPIQPVAGTADAAAMARGEPGLPARFVWRGTEHRVVALLSKWKTHGREPGGSKMYLRRHWYRVRTKPPAVMTLYCERQARSRKCPKRRWFVFTMEPAPR